MKKLGLAALLAAASAVPAVAGAQQNTMAEEANVMYGGAGLTWLGMEGPGSTEDNGVGLQGKIGYTFTPLLGVEGHFGLGLTDGSDTFFDPVNGARDVDLGVDYWAGVYGRAQFPVTQSVNVYGLLGLSYVEVDFSGFDEGSESDLSYGLGANYQLSEQLGAYAEWVSLVNKDNIEVSGLTVGAKFRF
jgi:opacity protein-like surface antigen